MRRHEEQNASRTGNRARAGARASQSLRVVHHLRHAACFAGPVFRVATYNAGLAVGVLPLVTQRLPHVKQALAALDLDLLFVQEVWLERHWHELREALADRWPHAVRPPAVGAPGGCLADDLAPFLECARTSCDGLRDEALARCVVASCAPVGLGLPAPCLNCMAADPSGTLDEIAARCLGRPAGEDTGGLLAYGGSLGTALLARERLVAADRIVYASTVNARGALYGRVGGWHVFATHFSPGGAEQAPQVARLVDWIGEKAGDEPALVLGDLNFTSGSALFRQLERAGFREPDELDGRGTYTAVGLGTGRLDAPWRIDHVLTRGARARVRSERVLDEAVRLDGGVVTTLSDHFGVVATIA